MADERRIVVELKVSSGSGESSAKKEKDEDDLTSMLKVMQHPIQSLEKATFGKNLLLYRAWQQGKALAKNSILYTAGRYFNLTENYKAEQDLENTFSVLENVTNLGTSIIGGAIAGAKMSGGNPYVAVAGAAVGATMWGFNVALNSIKAWESQNIQIATMNIESSFQKVRLGLVDNGRGTQN